MKRSLFIFIPALILIISLGLGFWMFNKKPASLRHTKTDYELDAGKLFEEYSQDETRATEKYQGRILAVSGILKEMQSLTDSTAILILGDNEHAFGVSCAIARNEITNVRHIEPGDFLKIKGECAGYLMDVNLVRCVPI